MIKIILILMLTISSVVSHAQGFNPNDPFAGENDDLNIGGDIFSNFNEDIEEAQIMEDERFFNYGRFFSLQMSFGMTTFDGNRGAAYRNNPPSYGFGINYFSDFQNSYGIGFELSKHHFFIDHPVHGHQEPLGAVSVNMLRFYLSYRHYIDTSNMGTAITYANPYFSTRMEYWYLTNQFIDQRDILNNDAGGGMGLAMGGGLEFPIKIKESYFGVEFLWHTVNFHDKYTQDYRPLPDGDGYGYSDLGGAVYTLMGSYVINW